MPRINPGRTIGAEQNLAQRIKDEREARGWTQASLAARMTVEGCAIDQSAIFKTETGNPPRRVTVDELVALSRVFGISLDELVVPPALAKAKHVNALLDRYRALRAQAAELARQQRALAEEQKEIQAQLVTEASDHDVKAAIKDVVAQWLPEENPERARGMDSKLVEFFTEPSNLDHGFRKAKPQRKALAKKAPAKKISPRKGTKA
jgi:transcriptional regulator with XRE-family HTH domain